MTSEPIEQIADYSDEPAWLEISWKYEELAKTTAQLNQDIGRYNKALRDLDAAGVSVMNGKERIAVLRDFIAQMESK